MELENLHQFYTISNSATNGAMDSAWYTATIVKRGKNARNVILAIYDWSGDHGEQQGVRMFIPVTTANYSPSLVIEELDFEDGEEEEIMKILQQIKR